MGLLADIQLAEFVKPEGDELRADSGLGNLLIGDLDFQIFFRGFQFPQAGLGGFGEDALLDSVEHIVNALFCLCRFPDESLHNIWHTVNCFFTKDIRKCWNISPT